MFGTRWRLFRLAGIPISLDVSWLIILALIVWSLTGVFRVLVPNLPPLHYWVMGVLTALTFFACIVLHELGHALVARSLGMPIRGITLFLFGGVAELEGEPPSAWIEFRMAIAGPAVSAVLALLFFGLTLAAAAAGWARETWAVFLYLFWINTAVLVFNLIPAFPLDGGRVLRSILWGATGNLRRATLWASLAGKAFAWLLIGVGVWEFFRDDFVGGIWMGLIGLFLRQAAESGYQQVLLREALQGVPVGLFMNREPVQVPPALDLRRWVEDYVYRYNRKFFPVSDDGHLEGVISTRALARYPREEWPLHTVAEAMTRDLGPVSVTPETDALEALGRMQRTGSSRLLVTDAEHHLVGIVSLKDLLGFLNQKLELGDLER
jgi:Zn-dependent protease/CBS domain-containing protein